MPGAAAARLRSHRTSHEVGDDHVRRFADIADPRALVGCRLLERRELALEQRRRHEMPAALGQTLREQLTTAREIDELRVRAPGRAKEIAIAPLQCGARDHEADPCAPRVVEPVCDSEQPTTTVVVGQRDAGRHPLHVLRRMQIVPFDEVDMKRGGELRSDQAFAGARNAHDHVEPSVASAHEVAPILYHRRIRGYSAGVAIGSSLRGSGGAARMQLAMIGLGRMGGNMVRRLVQGGHELIAYDQSADAVKSHVGTGAKGAKDLADVVRQLTPPRVVWIMVPAAAVEGTIEQLVPHLSRGDIVIDGGNSNFRDSLRRGDALKGNGIEFVDVGTSGGIWGLTLGYCLMIGASLAAFQHCEPIFRSLAAPEGYAHVGPCGAGHYVKMVHNGIEYGLLQAYAEGYEILHASDDFKLGLGQIAKLWNHGSVVRSWLNELAEKAFSRDDQLAGIRGYVEDSGEGRWTVEEAMRLNVPAPVITLSLLARFRSRQEESFGAKVVAALRHEFGGHAVQTK